MIGGITEVNNKMEIKIENKNYFIELNSIDCKDKIEQKNGLSYLSWAWAWGELKKKHPTATYKIYEDKNENCYFNDGKTGWVKTGVIVENIEHIEYLPIMDFRNKSIPVGNITSFDVNKAIQRSLTKAVARHGLGLYIYAGEDLPEGSEPKVLNFEEFKQALMDCISFNELKSIWADNALRFKDNAKQYAELENVKNSKKEELNELEDPKLAKALADKFNNDNKGK